MPGCNLNYCSEAYIKKTPLCIITQNGSRFDSLFLGTCAIRKKYTRNIHDVFFFIRNTYLLNQISLSLSLSLSVFQTRIYMHIHTLS